MPSDLTARVVKTWDTTDLLDGGATREVTMVRFMVGRYGPFEAKFDRNPPRHEIDAVLQAKKTVLDGLVE